MKKRWSLLMVLVSTCIFCTHAEVVKNPVTELTQHANSLKVANNSSKIKIPEHVTTWINSALSKAKNKSFLSDENFFCRDSAKLMGYLKGYDAKSGFTTGIIYLDNVLTNEEYPITAQINPDGTFEANLPMVYPVKTFITFGNDSFNFYIEPGQTLAIILDWKQYLIKNRKSNTDVLFKVMNFLGPSAAICSDLSKYRIKNTRDYSTQDDLVKQLTPNEYLQKERSLLQENLTNITNLEQVGLYHPKTIELWINQAIASWGYNLFDFIEIRNIAKKETSNPILRIPATKDYYNFIKEMPLNNPRLLVNFEYKMILNRFEFSDVFGDVLNSLNCKIFSSYLIEDKKISVTDEMRAADEYMNHFYKMEKTPENRIKFKEMYAMQNALLTKYAQELNDYTEYKKNVDQETEKKRGFLIWQIKDSILVNDLKMKPNLTYDITKIRDLKFEFESLNKNEANYFYKTIRATISNPFLQEEGQRFLLKTFPEKERTAYELPKDKTTEIIKKIIAPFKGKVLLIDFWATFCAPCIENIRIMKGIRDIYKGSDKLDFLFITSEGDSPIDRYLKFVKEQDLVNTFRLSSDDYNTLRQLFKFNSIPHYILIDKEGMVLNDDFNMSGFNRFEQSL